MSSKTDSLKLRFMGWHRPVLQGVLELLEDRWKDSAWELSDTLLLVPTAETGRRLREAMAVEAARRNGAVMAPYVWSPEAAIMAGAEVEKMASHLEQQLIWTHVLETQDLTECPDLFPTTPVVERRAWASGVAETLTELRRSTGSGGLSFADVSEAQKSREDAARWRELEMLEQRYLSLLEQLEVLDDLQIKVKASKSPVLPDGVSRILVLCLADPPALLIHWLKAASRQVSVEVLIQAPAVERHRFDENGLPNPVAWVDQPLRSSLSGDQLHVENLAEQQAHKVVELLRKLAVSGHGVAVGLADPSLSSHLVGALTGEGVEVYDPTGRKAAQHAVLDFLRTWQDLLQGSTWRKFMIFLRQDDVLRVLAAEAKVSPENVLGAMDAFFAQRLPATLRTAHEISGGPPVDDREVSSGQLALVHAFTGTVLERLDEWQGGASLMSSLRTLLEWIFGSREFQTEDEQDRDYALLLGEIMKLAHESESAAVKLGWSDAATRLLPGMIRELEKINLADLRGKVGLVLRGWLELLWEPAPGLVVGGFNDETVPGVVTVDAFLPDHVRERLGLSCQRNRWARDAYLLAALHEQRRASGELHLVVGQSSDDGDVLRPSRLLFSCDDEALPRRVAQLFPKDTEHVSVQEPAQSLAWQLQPENVEGWEHKISPSLLKSYLHCPARCYLNRVLGMSPIDPSQREMSVMDFGDLIHAALHDFGNNEAVRDSFNESEIADYLDDALQRLARELWGGRPLLSTSLQIENARQRLAYAAREQALLRSSGWRITEVEYDLNKDGALTLGGLIFSARVDRVDQHHDGRIRVLDYKTSHKGRSPENAHTGSVKKAALEDEALAWKCFTGARGGAKQWMDLQLPLYVWALKQLHLDAPSIEAGYFQLPAAVTETKTDIWSMDDELLEKALACAEQAALRIKQGVFWPPSTELLHDDFEELLLGNAVDSLKPDSFVSPAVREEAS